ncbi:lysozyme inhibitor LprI family protein [Photobacterium sp. S4TG1]|uniref:lysozyme inhibitor LprI family protein n=1 Tax=Photobacterium sp. S4TG1 TaxID=3114587 RepID=UPI002E1859D9|nr:lysozyme inhibitor LprI family protein [Photobacterium sp. S4TG1]
MNMKKLWVISVLMLSGSAMASTQTLNCDEAYSTLEINQCAEDKLNIAEQQLQVYLAQSLYQNSTDKALIDAINTAQKQWLLYRKTECNAVYTQWRQGTIRGMMTLSCQLTLTQQRALTLWHNYLRLIDGSAALLPKPIVDSK